MNENERKVINLIKYNKLNVANGFNKHKLIPLTYLKTTNVISLLDYKVVKQNTEAPS